MGTEGTRREEGLRWKGKTGAKQGERLKGRVKQQDMDHAEVHKDKK